jgi:hypothetical protein
MEDKSAPVQEGKIVEGVEDERYVLFVERLALIGWGIALALFMVIVVAIAS